MLPCSGDCFTAVSGGDEEDRSIRKSKQNPDAGWGDIRPMGSAADGCREGGVDSRTGGSMRGNGLLSTAWLMKMEWTAAKFKHTFLFMKACLKYVWHKLLSTLVVHSSEGRWFQIFHILWNVRRRAKPLYRHDFSDRTEQQHNSRRSSQKHYKGSNLADLLGDTQVWGCNFSRTWDI